MYKTRSSFIRDGMTLIELLVVLAILMILVSVTIPLVRMVSDDQPIQEVIRIVQMQMAAAQSRAIASGRDVAVILVRSRNGVPDDAAYASLDAQSKQAVANTMNTVFQVALAESPPPFSGLAQNEPCAVTSDGNVGTAEFAYDITRFGVREGDAIRFDFRGREYSIVGLNVAASKTKVFFRPAPLFIKTANVGPLAMRYQVFRAPRRTADPPITLPPGAFIDLDPSEEPFVANTTLTTMTSDETSVMAYPFASDPNVNPSAMEDVQFVFSPEGHLRRIRGLSGAASRLLFVGGQQMTSAELVKMPVPMLFPVNLAVRGGTPLAPRLNSVEVLSVSPIMARSTIARAFPASSGSGQQPGAEAASLPRHEEPRAENNSGR